MEDPREARRMRILKRGSDRLAFITGQIGSLPCDVDVPPPPPSPPLKQEEIPRSPSVAPPPGDGKAGFQVNNFDIRTQDVNSKPVDKKGEAGTGVSEVRSRNRILNCESENDTKLNETEKRAEIKENRSEPEPNRVGTSMPQRSYNRDAGNSALPHKIQAIFSSKQITDSISASENIRMVCAMVIGLLYVLLYHAQSLGCEVQRSIFDYRPLLLVLMTNVTIVLAQLIASGGAGERVKERTKSKTDDWADNLGKTLEVSLVFKKSITAIFMDCSICAVILVCGVGI